MNGRFFRNIGLCYQTTEISDQKIGYGYGLGPEDNLLRAAQEGSVRRAEDEGIK